MVQVHDNLETICNEVIDTCLYKGSRDNMSIIIIAFPSAPKVVHFQDVGLRAGYRIFVSHLLILRSTLPPRKLKRT